MHNKFKVKAAEIPVGTLHLHAKANRELRPGRVRTLEREMDLDALGRFAVWRDGHNLYVIDGQHRKIALEQLGLSDWKVRCDVYEGMTFAEACEQFLKLNDALTVRPYDKFDKGVKAGRMEYVETDRIIRKAGFTPAPDVRDGNLVCTQAALDTWKLDQGAALEMALDVSTSAWGHTAVAVEGQVVRGLGILAARHNGAIDYPALVKKLAKYPGGPPNILGAAKAQRELHGGTLGKSVADVIIAIYNKGRRSGQLA